MTRRQVIKRLALALGGTLSVPVVGAALSCRRPIADTAPWAPRTLTEDQNELVTAIAEVIIPATDTPGAKDADVNEFIDLLLTDWLDEEERSRFLAGLAELDAACRERYQSPLQELGTEQQLELLQPRDIAGVEARIAEEDPLPFFATMKEMTLVGYYTSEIGMTQELEYRFHFESFEGCVPLAESGRAWS